MARLTYRQRAARSRPSDVLPGHRASYEVERDPEGNFWTVTCSCGRFQESTSSRSEARHEHWAHRRSVRGTEQP
jgi:hypothetical protein